MSQDMEIPVGMLNKWWLQRDDISTQFERYCAAQVSSHWLVELCEDFTITEKAPTRAFSWLKAPTSALTFRTLLRDYAKL